jgi:hypothetical protein
MNSALVEFEDGFKVVTSRNALRRWQERVGCVFADERLADNMLEIKRSQDVTGQYAKVSGIPFMPETEAEAEARLGAFK